MSFQAVAQIEPQVLVQHIGRYPIAFSQSLKGEGHHADADFMDIETKWTPIPVDVEKLKELYIETLTRRVLNPMMSQAFNFIEFWGWPEVRIRDDGCGMVYSRMRVLRVVVPQPAPRMN